MTRLATLCYLTRGNRVLLIRKKRGFGEGRYNGVGGKVERGEPIVAAAVREVIEEVGVEPLEMRYAGVLRFYSLSESPDWVVFVYTCRVFKGEPKPSDEAEPYWFPTDRLPYDEMWEDDRLWLPHVLKGGVVSGDFWFDAKYERLLDYKIRLLESPVSAVGEVL